MSVLQRVVVQINGGLAAMADNRIEVESIRESAYDGFLILALIFLGCTRRSARTGIAIGDVLYLIYIGYRSIDSIGILGLPFHRPCRNSHVNSINHLAGSLVCNCDNALAAGFHRLVKLYDQMRINVNVLGIFLWIKTDRRLCHQFHTDKETCRKK